MQLSNSLTPRSIASSNYLLRQYGGAAAAYSLQRLDTSVENVVRARRSTDDAEADFTAQEVSGGSLREFALNNDADLIRFADQAVAADKRMYFDGVSDYVEVTGMTAAGDYFGACTIGATIYLEDAAPADSYTVFSLGANCYKLFVNSASLWCINTLSTGVTATPGKQTVAVDFNASGQATELRIDGVTVWTGTIVAGSLAATSFYIGCHNFPSAPDAPFKGLIYDFSITGSAVKNFAFNGYGNTNADWEDQVGSNDGTVNGSPALFSGQGFDAYVTTLYDQSGALGQPLSRFAQHATAADTRMQFDGVNDLVRVSGLTSSASYFGACTIEATVYAESPSTTQAVWALGSDCYRLYASAGTWKLNGVEDTSVSVVSGIVTLAVDYDASGQAIEFRVNGVTEWTGTAAAGTVPSTTFDIGARAGGLFFKGVIYDFSITGSAVNNFAFNGYGNTNADWEDQVGSNDGTVAGSPSIYEGRNALQATAASQPQIVADGVVVTDSNGNAAMDFDGSGHHLDADQAVSGTTGRSAFVVVEADTVASNEAILSLTQTSGGGGTTWNFTAETAIRVTGAETWTSNPMTSLSLGTITLPDASIIGDHEFYLNGSQKTSDSTIGTDSINTTNDGATKIGTYVSTYYDGKISEIILYASDKSSDREAIEANIASRYGITLA